MLFRSGIQLKGGPAYAREPSLLCGTGVQDDIVVDPKGMSLGETRAKGSGETGSLSTRSTYFLGFN